MENLRVYLLGTFRVYRDGVLLTARDWQIRHARQLFKLLFTERGHTVPASKVIDLLWPYSAEHTHKTLRGVVSILRSVLEPGRAPGDPSRFVPRGSMGYTLVLPNDGSVWVDAIEFERLLDETSSGHESPRRRRLLESALQLYTGDYLAEDEQESWTLAERARLRERYFSSAQSLMEIQQKLGLYNEAIAVGRRALAFDSCREPLYPIMMHCQIALGDTVGALQTFELCRQELHNRLGVDPSPHTLKLHTELLRGDLPIFPDRQALPPTRKATLSAIPRAAGNADAPSVHTNGSRKHATHEQLVGRKEISDYLLHYTNILLDKHARPKTRTIALAGEMGVGKSFLLRWLLNHVRSSNMTTMITVCQAVEQRLAFAPLLVMVKAWLAGLESEELQTLPLSALAVLVHLLPELEIRVPNLSPASFLNAEQAYSGYIMAFVDLFQALSLQRPLLVVIDDLQWADEASLLVLHRLARASMLHTSNGSSSSLLLLPAYRPEDVPENAVLHGMLLSLSRCTYFHTLQVPRFTPDEVGEYLRSHSATSILAPPQFYQATQGNALFLAELTRLLTDQKEHGAVVQTTFQHEYLPTLLQHSSKLRDVVLARLTCLPERARELLEQAAVIARPFSPALLGPALSAEDYKLLDTLLARRFLVEGDEQDHAVHLAFVHHVVARIIYSHCSALRRSQLHLHTAEQLVRHSADDLDRHSAEIAFHYRHAGPQYQTQALQYESTT